MRHITCAILGMCIAALPANAEKASLTNSSFEAPESGKSIPGWELNSTSRKFGYEARIAADRPFDGKGSLELRLADWPKGFGHYGLVTQLISAKALRGKRIRFQSAIRADVPYAGLQIRVLRPDFKPGHVTDMADRPVISKDWKQYSVVVDVANDADAIELGLTLTAKGTAWFDDAWAEVIGKAGDGNEAPRPLTKRGLENLVSFARLLGIVRYFHPSDEAATANWERFAIDKVSYIEAAESAPDLVDRLRQSFAPLAPTVQVFMADQQPPPIKLAPAKDAIRLVAWRHVGVAANGVHGHYRSERVTDRELQGAAPLTRSLEPLPKTDEPYEVDLGNSVRARVPVALYAEVKGTLPRATAKDRPPLKPADFPPTGNDRATRVADVMLAWNMFQHFYPYFDAVKTDWPAVLRDSLTAAATDLDAAAFHDTLKRLVALAHDSHGTVRGGSGTVRLDGALPVAWDWIEDRLVIVSVEKDHAAGIQPGDVVRSIDGEPALERMTSMERLVSGATPQFRRYRAMQELRNGPAGQIVTLELDRPNGTRFAVKLPRKLADDSPLRGPSLREWRLPRFQELKPGILYVDLDRYDDKDFFREIAPKLNNAHGLIFDVRGYPGVGMALPQLLAGAPIQSDRFADVITRFPDRKLVKFDERPWTLKPFGPPLKAKAAFLTDGRAVSYAETFLSLVANHKLAPIVGGPTAGSNGGVNIYVLPGGYRVSYTGQLTIRKDGSRFHGIGVRPTHPVARTIRAVAAGRDEVLEKALELVTGKSSG